MNMRQADDIGDDDLEQRALVVLHALEALETHWRPRSRDPQDLTGPAIHWPFAALYLESTRGQIDLAQRLCWPEFHYAVIGHFFHLYSQSVLARLDGAVPMTAVRCTPGWERYFATLDEDRTATPSMRRSAVLGVRAHINDDLGPAILAAFGDVRAPDGTAGRAAVADRAQATLFHPFAGALHQIVRRGYLRRIAALPPGSGAGMARLQPHHMTYWLPATVLLAPRLQGIRRRAWRQARRALMVTAAGPSRADQTRPTPVRSSAGGGRLHPVAQGGVAPHRLDGAGQSGQVQAGQRRIDLLDPLAKGDGGPARLG